eukprot:CAMPEP_0196578842 /NCGR_PEP_ID=MMETSP1081-20130531/10543_1 /TAXON_ID=36882 /ORGANISM="Pyramimonas amylifera, Strain CCMP720" /LENGTH=113 /DNA_ID=CAMNT_0041898209 /DNA_START=232 /DNA_END=573 /DNA_ORIENTATION=+
MATGSPVDKLAETLSFYPPIIYSTPIQIATVPTVATLFYVAFFNPSAVDFAGDSAETLVQVLQYTATAIGAIHLASGAGAAYVATEKDLPVAPAVAKNLLIGFPAFLEILLDA